MTAFTGGRMVVYECGQVFTPMNGSASVKSAVRVLDLLEALSRAEAPVGVSEISRSLGIPKSTTHMLLTTLESRGYVVGDALRRFHLNPIFSAQGSWIGGAGAALLRIAREPMDELARATGESSFLGVGRDEASVEYIAKVVSAHELRCDGNLGEAKPMHSTSIGLTLLAFQDPERTERFLARGKFERLTQHSTTSASCARKSRDGIRHRGYLIVCDTNSPGVSGVAAPILDSTGRAVAGLNISAPSPRFRCDAAQIRGSVARGPIGGTPVEWRTRASPPSRKEIVMTTAAQRRKALKDRIESGRPLVIPGSGDALGARLTEKAGFEAAYMSGFAVEGTHAFPDVGYLGDPGDVRARGRRGCDRHSAHVRLRYRLRQCRQRDPHGS